MLSFCIVLCFNTIGLVQTVANEDKKGTTVAFTHASFPICLNKCEHLWNLNTDAFEATMREVDHQNKYKILLPSQTIGRFGFQNDL